MVDGARAQERAAWDAVAPAYADMLPDLSPEAPLDRAVLAAFAETVAADGGGVVAEVGCGTGRVTAHLAAAGLHVVGLDQSPGMAQQARAVRPHLAFAAADTAALPVRSGALAGVVAWYSLITTPTAGLAPLLAECARVVRPGAQVVVAWQSGDGGTVVRETSYGLPVRLVYHRHRVADVVAAAGQAGLVLHATLVREPRPGLAHETTPQAFLVAQRP